MAIDFKALEEEFFSLHEDEFDEDDKEIRHDVFEKLSQMSDDEIEEINQRFLDIHHESMVENADIDNVEDKRKEFYTPKLFEEHPDYKDMKQKKLDPILEEYIDENFDPDDFIAWVISEYGEEAVIPHENRRADLLEKALSDTSEEYELTLDIAQFLYSEGIIGAAKPAPTSGENPV